MKKWSIAHFCAYLSLAISITLLVLWCCNVGGFTVVNLDSFVGVIVALLAIIVTLAIGWQISNSIDIKTKIKELSSLEERIKEQEKKFGLELIKSEQRVAYIYGYSAMKDEDYINAFRYNIIALAHAMKLDKPNKIESTLKGLEVMCDKIPEDSTYPSDLYKEICLRNDSIKESLYYGYIKERYDKIYNSFISKVKEINE